VRRVKVDGHAARVVQRADEVVDGRVRRQLADQGRIGGRPDPLALEADKDVDMGCIFGLQPGGFGEVGRVAGEESGEGGFGGGG
jgi:hypothetical protein